MCKSKLRKESHRASWEASNTQEPKDVGKGGPGSKDEREKGKEKSLRMDGMMMFGVQAGTVEVTSKKTEQWSHSGVNNELEG
jgi:hypothetical protein